MSTSLRMTGLAGDLVQLTAEDLAGFAMRFSGTLLREGDAGWSDAISVWNAMAARVPALVLQPASARDVAHAVSFARDRGLRLSIKGGGHNIAGTSIVERGVVLDLSKLRDVRVLPDEKRAQVGPGCLLRDVDRATQEHGLAMVLGFFSGVGVAGLTLGGGLGYLSRRFGWTVDHLEEVEIVTADGALRTANRRENADLFWALRGGGGNFGVVTRFTFALHEVGPQVYGGLIAWPFARADEILRRYRALTVAAPRELAVWMMLLRAPSAPFVPEAWQGERICAMSVCYSGDLRRVAEALAPIKAIGDPVFDLLHEQPYVELQSYLDATEPKGNHYYWKTEYAAELSDDFLETWRGLAAECPIPDGELGLLHLGGALNERAPDDGAVGNRDARYALGALGMWPPDAADAAAYREWIREAWQRFRRFSTGNYVNFQTADEDEERLRQAYGRNLERLVEIKKIYDPTNLFRSNRNISP